MYRHLVLDDLPFPGILFRRRRKRNRNEILFDEKSKQIILGQSIDRKGDLHCRHGTLLRALVDPPSP